MSSGRTKRSAPQEVSAAGSSAALRVRIVLAVLFLVLAVICAVLVRWSSTDVSATQASASGAPTALPASGDVDTRCSDPVGDSAGVDVTDVALVSQDQELIVAFDFAAQVPTNGTATLTIELQSQDGAQVRQLGVDLQDGQPAGAFILASPTSEPVKLDDAVHIADGEVHAAFPLAVVSALGPRWTWLAMAGGKDTIDDYCPSAVSSVSVG